MFKLLIKTQSQQKQLFKFENSITIGRDDDVDLQLNDPSISRQHAQIHIVGEEVIAEDLGSQNGIVVDGQRLREGQRLPLKSKSEVQMGKFTLILLTNSQEDNFYRGRSIAYLPDFNPESITRTEADTLQLSSKQATQLLRQQNLLNNACIIDELGKQIFPEANTITFGSAGTFKIKGFLTGKIVAEVTWNGTAHVLTKKGGFLSSIKVNDQAITEQTLTINHRIQIGSSSFKYVLHSEN